MNKKIVSSFIAVFGMILLVAALAGCQQATSGSSSTAASSPAGTWTSDSSGTFTLASDGSFSWTLDSSEVASGTYSYTSTTITLSIAKMYSVAQSPAVDVAATISGTASGSTMTFTSSGITYTYTKK